jgi:outer membrane protein assembly factor BamB
MIRLCQRARLLPVLLAGAALAMAGGGFAHAQIGPGFTTARFELADTVQLNQADSTILGNFQRVKAYLADRQWDEAVETLRKVLEHSEDKLVGVTDRRYVSLRDYVHLQLASLPPEALALYRSRIDPTARKWCEEGIARRDPRLLRNVLRQAFASSWGDNALTALGEMALESGDYTSARWYWERVVPAELPPDLPRTWPGYPDSDLDLAAVRARLVLTSILEGSYDRAREELAQFTRLHGGAVGRFGGRETNYAQALAAMLAESGAWPQPAPRPDWPTFAGAFTRERTAPALVDIGKVAWRWPLAAGSVESAGEPVRGPLAINCYPVLVGDQVLLCNRQDVAVLWSAATARELLESFDRRKLIRPEHLDQARALSRETDDAAAFAKALIARDMLSDPTAAQFGSAGLYYFRSELQGVAGLTFEPPSTLGIPQFTMTAHSGRLYARLGSGVTSRPPQTVEKSQGDYLVCLDLAAEGRLIWKAAPEEGWAFEGSPVVDGGNVYAAMRRSDIRPQAHVACLDAQTGRQRWRRFVCGAETPERGILFACSHNLLTLEGETLFLNTNLGAVAALSAEDGSIRWVSLYPRALQGNAASPAAHWRRAVNPCVADRGTLYVAPADSPRIFAFDAATGQMLWQTGEQLGDVLHLLGIAGDHLVACGEKLYWIDVKPGQQGRVKHVWPGGDDKPGYGRGILAGDQVLWPARENIYVFDARTAQPRKVFDLRPQGLTGGNLLVVGGRLLIVTDKEVVLMGAQGGSPAGDSQGVTSLPVARPPSPKLSIPNA